MGPHLIVELELRIMGGESGPVRESHDRGYHFRASSRAVVRRLPARRLAKDAGRRRHVGPARYVRPDAASGPGVTIKCTEMELFHCTGRGIGDLSILLRKHTRNTDCANNLAVDDNRDAALVRNSSLKPENS